MRLVWCNGAMAEGPLALDAADRGITLGDGLFETLLTVNRTALWRNMHLARMEGSAHELGLPFDRDLADLALDTLLGLGGDAHQVLRLTLTRGSGVRGLAANGSSPTLLATLEPFDRALMFQPTGLITASVRRSPQSPAARLKTLSYIDNIVAAREAKARGYDDALMLNTRGAVACSTIANVFLLKGGRLITPNRDQGLLTGVMRQALIACAHRAGLEPQERSVKPSELATADAVFLTNSLRFLRPVTALDGEPLAQADLTPLADQLCEAARLQCGRDPRLP